MILFYFILIDQTTKQQWHDKNKLLLNYTWPMQYFFDTLAIIPFFDDQSLYLIYDVQL